MNFFCENCNAHNAKAIILYNGEDPQYLCPRCLKILEGLEEELKSKIENN